jgi:hypothetical protein
MENLPHDFEDLTEPDPLRPELQQIKNSAAEIATSNAITALHRLAVSTDPAAIRPA